jgi:hypothetical protein
MDKILGDVVIREHFNRGSGVVAGTVTVGHRVWVVAAVCVAEVRGVVATRNLDNFTLVEEMPAVVFANHLGASGPTPQVSFLSLERNGQYVIRCADRCSAQRHDCASEKETAIQVAHGENLSVTALRVLAERKPTRLLGNQGSHLVDG